MTGLRMIELRISKETRVCKTVAGLIFQNCREVYGFQILFLNINDMPRHNKLLIIILKGIDTLPKSRPLLEDFMMSLPFSQQVSSKQQ